MPRRGRPENLTAWKPGQSGHPGGRPKGFVARIKDVCGEDYERLAKGFEMIAFGPPAERRTFFGEPVTVTARDRIAAMVELRDSGPGRPAQTISADVSKSFSLFIMDPADEPRTM